MREKRRINRYTNNEIRSPTRRNHFGATVSSLEILIGGIVKCARVKWCTLLCVAVLDHSIALHSTVTLISALMVCITVLHSHPLNLSSHSHYTPHLTLYTIHYTLYKVITDLHSTLYCVMFVQYRSCRRGRVRVAAMIQ